MRVAAYILSFALVGCVFVGMANAQVDRVFQEEDIRAIQSVSEKVVRFLGELPIVVKGPNEQYCVSSLDRRASDIDSVLTWEEAFVELFMQMRSKEDQKSVLKTLKGRPLPGHLTIVGCDKIANPLTEGMCSRDQHLKSMPSELSQLCSEAAALLNKLNGRLKDF